MHSLYDDDLKKTYSNTTNLLEITRFHANHTDASKSFSSLLFRKILNEYFEVLPSARRTGWSVCRPKTPPSAYFWMRITSLSPQGTSPSMLRCRRNQPKPQILSRKASKHLKTLLTAHFQSRETCFEALSRDATGPSASLHHLTALTAASGRLRPALPASNHLPAAKTRRFRALWKPRRGRAAAGGLEGEPSHASLYPHTSSISI